MPSIRLAPFVVAVCHLAFAVPALGAPPEDFSSRVDGLLDELGVPGATVAIVEDGSVTMARGFGVRSLEDPMAVDADTIFATGSTGKAFTTAALAILVDRGVIKWGDRVIDHMPDFRMWDAWVTREMTIRDLLVHRSGLGLGAGDLLFVPRSDLSRKETMRRLRHIKPATSFRSGYAYDNVLYMVAGQLVEEVTGDTWETFVQENIFDALGMNNSTVSDQALISSTNRARPHARLNGAIRGMGDQVPLDETSAIAPNAAPAGGLAISANDMTHWLQAQLGRGKMPGGERQLFSGEQSAQMWTPAVLLPNSPPPESLAAAHPMFRTYALGWTVQDYRGAKLVWHGGAVFGSLAVVALLPDQNVGFYVAVNSEEGQMVRGLLYELLDHYLGYPEEQWPEKLHEFKTGRQVAAAAAVQAQLAPADDAPVTKPSLALAGYTGDYNDPWYGTISIRDEDGALVVDFPHSLGLSATLEHVRYNTFITHFNDPGMEPAYLTFNLDASGQVSRITAQAVSPIADFSFDYQDLLFTPVSAK
ncbi:serine hydrolase [Kordiimonas sp.]|uniref:serine hydrolase n=1 Tax=Kordiimonas sp. TaxID=1970157 RepID=UPI003A8D8D2A